MKRVKRFAVAAALIVACSDPTGLRGSLLRGRSTPHAVVLTNYHLVPERPGASRFRPDSIRPLAVPLTY